MDKVENWVTWGLLAALLYQAMKPQQYAPVCTTGGGTGWGVSDALAAGGSGGVAQMSGYASGGCSCGE